MLKSHFKGRSLASCIAGVMKNGSCEFKDLISASGLDADNGEVSDIDLSGIDLSNQDLSKLDLAEASFKDANINQTNLQGAKFDPIEIQLSEDHKKAILDQQDLNEIESARHRFMLAVPLASLDISQSTRSDFNFSNILVIGELVQLDEEELLWIQGFGETFLSEVIEILKAFGLSIEMKLRQDLQNLFQHPKAPFFEVEVYLIERFGEDFLNRSYFIHNLFEVRRYKSLTDEGFSRQTNLSKETLKEYEKKRKNIGISGMQLFSFIKVLGRYSNLLEVTVK